MRFPMLILMLSLFCAQTFAQEYYRWVDENGTLHLSDSPPNTSVEINLNINIIEKRNPIFIDAPASPDIPSAPPLADAPETIKNATHLVLTSPENDATIRNNQGNILVKIVTNAPLGEKQFVRVLLDGKSIATKQRNTITLKDIDRGSHSLQVQLIENNKIISSTKKITVFLHRGKINASQGKGNPSN